MNNLELIKRYKSRIAQTRMQDEKYKWELLSQFKGKPNTNAPDFGKEYKSVKYGNLMYQLAAAVGKHICRENPEGFRSLFIALFDESKPLKDRIANFSEDSLKLYRSIGGEKGHHQDERTIATYLTFHNPEKYTLYKSSFYKPFCELMQVKPAGKNLKYVHYLELIDRFILDYVANDQELIEQVKSYIPEYYDGSNHLILAQDILYTMLDKDLEEEQVNYKERFAKWLNSQNQDGSNKSASYLRAIDLLQEKVDFIIYETADKSILQELYSDLIQKQKDNEGPYFNENAPSYGNNGYYSAAIKTYIEFHENLSRQHTDSEFNKFIQQFSKSDFDQFVKFACEIIREHQLRFGDERLTFNYYDDRLVISVGQRYCLGLFANDKKRKFSVLSIDPISANGEEFEGENSKAFLNYLHDLKLSESQVQNIHNGIRNELKRTNRSGYRKHNKIDFEKFVFEHANNNGMRQPLNQILYGPPGTGKTYNSVNKALEVLGVNTKSLSRSEIKKHFDEAVENGQIVFATFHQSMSYEDFIEGIKPKTVGTNVVYEIKNGIFKKISDLAKDNYELSKNPLSNFSEVLELLKNELAESENNELRIETKKTHFFVTNITDRNIEFRKASGATNHDLVITTLKELFLGKREMLSGLAVYYYPLIEKLKNYKLVRNAPSLQNYVLLIDEINRGNVSQIFGELITLIEDGKRLGQDEAITLKLPYSQEDFVVPPNLYIIGTMNTADRSVEALDTALRRRFSFVEMMPKPELLEDRTVMGINMKELLLTINKRIEALIDRDHTIGHAYLIDVQNEADLKRAFKDKIIPLLQEYFFGDYGKIGLVLGSGFVKKGEIKDTIFTDFEYEGRDGLIQTTYELIPFEEVEFETAMKQLIKS